MFVLVAITCHVSWNMLGTSVWHYAAVASKKAVSRSTYLLLITYVLTATYGISIYLLTTNYLCTYGFFVGDGSMSKPYLVSRSTYLLLTTYVLTVFLLATTACQSRISIYLLTTNYLCTYGFFAGDGSMSGQLDTAAVRVLSVAVGEGDERRRSVAHVVS